MRIAETILESIEDRGSRGLPNEEIYRHLYNPDLLLRAYGRIYKRPGATTQGITEETTDGMSMEKINSLIEKFRCECYQWTPVRRIYIPKKNGGRRPLGIPVWQDKLVQEAMRSILEATPLETLADKLNSEVGELFRAGKKEDGLAKREQYKQVNKKLDDTKDAVGSLERHSFAYESGLPLELGKASQQLTASIGQLDPKEFDGLPPLVEELRNTIASVATESAFATAPTNGGWKTNVALDENELKRQAGMIDLYLERDQLPLAVGLMREWVVSWAILKCGDSSEIEKWLDRGVRLRYERRLGALGAFARGGITITDEQQKFGTFWNQLTDSLRNVLHHHAMREDALERPPGSLESVREFWDQLKGVLACRHWAVGAVGCCSRRKGQNRACYFRH